ncbi:MAG: type IV secretion protein IcmS [Gammaproteobacteria bacterium RIFCSPHIGHO2_12_FULL_45_9]|nr:MAG: type IV secretion protein IcmS [Gammaproteobacteria bacterium RIFCSPHIGHO2_12_FULL_45_9]
MATKLQTQLQSVAKKMGVIFTFKGKTLSHTEVFAEEGLLPGLVKRADQLASLCLGYNLGATFEDVEGTALGKRVKLDEYTPDTLRLFCITDVLYELMRASPAKSAVALDDLLYD